MRAKQLKEDISDCSISHVRICSVITTMKVWGRETNQLTWRRVTFEGERGDNAASSDKGKPQRLIRGLNWLRFLPFGLLIGGSWCASLVPSP
jgi:hypothetical protein